MPFLDTNLLHKPQVNLSRSGPARMWFMSACALAVCAQSALGDGGHSAYVALGALLGGITAELLFVWLRNREAGVKCLFILRDGNAVLTALVLAMLLPNQISPVLAAAGAFFAIACAKQSLGGLGANWLNPALAGWLFVRMCWPGLFRAALASSPLELIRQTQFEGSPSVPFINFFPVESGTYLVSLTDFLNNNIFSYIHVHLDYKYLSLFVDPSPGIIADRGLLALVAGSIILLAVQACKTWPFVLYLGVTAGLTFFADVFNIATANGSPDMFFGLFTGGIFVTAVFLINAPATMPKTPAACVCVVAICSALGYFFRFTFLESYGAFFAVALCNTLVPLARKFETTHIYSRAPASQGRPA